MVGTPMELSEIMLQNLLCSVFCHKMTLDLTTPGILVAGLQPRRGLPAAAGVPRGDDDQRARARPLQVGLLPERRAGAARAGPLRRRQPARHAHLDVGPGLRHPRLHLAHHVHDQHHRHGEKRREEPSLTMRAFSVTRWRCRPIKLQMKYSIPLDSNAV